MNLLEEAKDYFRQGQYKIAEQLLGRLILNNSKDPEVYHMLATIYYDRGQFSKAIRTFRRALEIDPTFTDASVGLSIILNDLGRYEEGKQVFLEAERILQQRKQQNDPYLEEKIATKHQELADLYLQSHRPKEALEQLLKAQKISSRRAEISLRIADCYLQISEEEKAIITLKNLIRDYPNFLTARMRLANVYYQSGKVAEATHMWESVLARNPQHEEAARRLKMAQAVGVTEIDKDLSI